MSIHISNHETNTLSSKWVIFLWSKVVIVEALLSHIVMLSCVICLKIDGSLSNGIPMVPMVLVNTGTYELSLVQSQSWLVTVELELIYSLNKQIISVFKEKTEKPQLCQWFEHQIKRLHFMETMIFCIENWSLYNSSAIQTRFLSLPLSKSQN